MPIDDKLCYSNKQANIKREQKSPDEPIKHLLNLVKYDNVAHRYEVCDYQAYQSRVRSYFHALFFKCNHLPQEYSRQEQQGNDQQSQDLFY